MELVQSFNTPVEKATRVWRPESLTLLLYLVNDTDKWWRKRGAGRSSHCCSADAETTGPTLGVGLLEVGVVGFIGRLEVINCACVSEQLETFSSAEI
jgi:hypothetical protein